LLFLSFAFQVNNNYTSKQQFCFSCPLLLACAMYRLFLSSNVMTCRALSAYCWHPFKGHAAAHHSAIRGWQAAGTRCRDWAFPRSVFAAGGQAPGILAVRFAVHGIGIRRRACWLDAELIFGRLPFLFMILCFRYQNGRW
jgi:hypothetical protein